MVIVHPPYTACLGANLFNFVRIFRIQQLNLFLEMGLNRPTDFHAVITVDKIDGDTVLA